MRFSYFNVFETTVGIATGLQLAQERLSPCRIIICGRTTQALANIIGSRKGTSPSIKEVANIRGVGVFGFFIMERVIYVL